MNPRKKFLMVSLSVLLASHLLAGCARQDDVSFARNVMELLIRGRFSVRTMIDWSKLKILGYDISKEFGAYKTEEAQISYERAFIENFSRGFLQQKAKPTAFFNWRDVTKDYREKTRVVIANCFSEDYTFLFVIEHTGRKKKLIEIQAFYAGQKNPQGSGGPSQEGAGNDAGQAR